MFRNFLSLFLSFSAINIFNRLIPLITVPVLTNNLGLSSYGEYLVILSFTVLFDTFISFGFKTTAVIDLNFCKNKEEENNLFYRLFMSKLLLFIPSVFVLIFMLSFREISTLNSIIFCVSLLVGIALNQEWYFHGKGKMQSIVLINLSIRTLYLVIIYFFIRSPDDLSYALIAYSLTIFLQSGAGFIKAILEFKIKIPKSIDFNLIIAQYRNNIYFFSATLSSYFYTSFNFIILDNFYSPAIIGVYGIADKLVNAIRDFSNSFQNAFLPTLAKRYTLNLEQKNSLFLKYIGVVFILFSAISCVVFIYSDYLFLFFNSDSVYINLGSRLIKILILGLPVYVIIGSTSQLYLIQKQSKKLFWIISIFAFSSVITLTTSAYNFNIIVFGSFYVILMTVLMSILLSNILLNNF